METKKKEVEEEKDHRARHLLFVLAISTVETLPGFLKCHVCMLVTEQSRGRPTFQTATKVCVCGFFYILKMQVQHTAAELSTGASGFM